MSRRSPGVGRPLPRSRAIARLLPPALVLAALIGLWQVAARWDLIADALQIEPFLVPAPSDVAEALWNDRGLLADNAWVTIQEVVLGFTLAALCGFAFALALHLSDLLRRSFYPLLMASQTVPVIAIAPILVVWLGFGLGPKLVIIALVCFFPITVNTLDGLRSVDPELPRMMRTLDANRAQTLRRVEVPSALPFLLSGAKIAAVVSVIGAVFGEWSGADEGLGHLILVAQGQVQTARVFAAVIVLSAIAIALFGALALLERRVAWWRPARPSAGLARPGRARPRTG
jgi:putative hydroxymethylpyrimidine transport system permease protein